MKCPFCPSNETKVIDKRGTEDYSVTRRRRECLKCEKRFTTYERVEMINLFVVKKDGKREVFERGKLNTGISRACEKRPVSNEIISQILDEIEAKLRSLDTTEIKSRYIGELAMKALKKVDQVAYIRFASVYRDFADIESFEKELDKLKGNVK